MKACNQCGKCCINYGDGGLSATEEELNHWEDFRPDIYAYVNGGEIWCDPSTGKRLKRCPWLRLEGERGNGKKEKYACDIYEDRPEDCRYYPVSIDDMIKDACEMLEPRDLVNTKQAQKRLDILMIDSRPS